MELTDIENDLLMNNIDEITETDEVQINHRGFVFLEHGTKIAGTISEIYVVALNMRIPFSDNISDQKKAILFIKSHSSLQWTCRWSTTVPGVITLFGDQEGKDIVRINNFVSASIEQQLLGFNANSDLEFDTEAEALAAVRRDSHAVGDGLGFQTGLTGITVIFRTSKNDFVAIQWHLPHAFSDLYEEIKNIEDGITDINTFINYITNNLYYLRCHFHGRKVNVYDTSDELDNAKSDFDKRKIKTSIVEILDNEKSRFALYFWNKNYPGCFNHYFYPKLDDISFIYKEFYDLFKILIHLKRWISEWIHTLIKKIKETLQSSKSIINTIHVTCDNTKLTIKLCVSMSKALLKIIAPEIAAKAVAKVGSELVLNEFRIHAELLHSISKIIMEKIGSKTIAKVAAKGGGRLLAKETPKIAAKVAGKAGGELLAKETPKLAAKVTAKAGGELLAKETPKIAARVAAKTGGELLAKETPKISAKVASKAGGKVLAKETPKLVSKVAVKTGSEIFKEIPIVGLIMGIGFSIWRFSEGEVEKGILELASGVASTIPIVGTAVSLGIDASLIALDTIDLISSIQNNEINEAFITNSVLFLMSGDKFDIPAHHEKTHNKDRASVSDDILKLIDLRIEIYLTDEFSGFRILQNGNELIKEGSTDSNKYISFSQF